ncbi:hypothetical protein [Allomuricauda sp. ARW1Y1]|jgi:hypothetical protein|uniref:hypothetical protein n=1 Tax=Allomuricauda sp. ARW1Y1 TaxID=2663843 RepID=UPI0015C8EA8C|nr:hypothetical protein [Muricauda sp. ARW1Y1]NYJ27529.1 hypothetical protein [Muricauda sp. ARW1Y1]
MKKVLFALIFLTVVTVKAQRGVERFGGIILDTLTTTELLNLPSIAKVKGAYYHDITKGYMVTWNGSNFVAASGAGGAVDLTTNQIIGGQKTFEDGILSTGPSGSFPLSIRNTDVPANQINSYFSNSGTVFNWKPTGTNIGIRFDWNTEEFYFPVGHRFSTPTQTYHATTKSYVDTEVQGAKDYADSQIAAIPGSSDNSLSQRDQTIASDTTRVINTDGNGELSLQQNGVELMKVGGNNDLAVRIKAIEAIQGDDKIRFINPTNIVSVDTTLYAAASYSGFIVEHSGDAQVYWSNGTKWSKVTGQEGSDNSLSEANQFLGNNDRIIDVGVLGSLKVTKGASDILIIDGDGTNSFLLPSDPYDANWNGEFQPASKADVYAKIESVVAGSLPVTANQDLMTTESSSKVVADSLFASAALYNKREMWFTNNDTISGGDGVSSAYYGKWQSVIPLKDSIYWRPIDNDSLIVPGLASKIGPGQGYVVDKYEPFVYKKINDSTYYGYGNGRLHIEVASAIYQGANAADPVNEVNGTNGVTINATNHVVTSASTVTPQNGTYYLRFVQNAGDNTLSKSFIELTGVQAGQNVTVSFWVYEAQGTFWEGKLRTNLEDGVSDWSPEVSVNFDSQGTWTQYTLTSTASVNNPRLRISTTSLGDLNDEILIDNITVTIN